MSIFYETLESFKDFNSLVNIKIQQFLPEYSLFGNIIASYDSVLDDKQKIENKNYIEIKNKLELLNLEIEKRQDIIKKFTPLLLDFENCYNKKYGELEVLQISQKAFIRAKEDELNSYIASCELKMQEKNQLEEKMVSIKSDIKKLKSDISDRCQEYFKTVAMNNVDNLKSSIRDMSSSFSKNIQENTDKQYDYISSDEYLNPNMEYKEARKRLYTFMSGLFNATRHFIDESNVEKIFPDLVLIQDQIKEKYKNIDKLEVQLDKIKGFEDRSDNYYQALKNEEKKLENIVRLADKDEELLRMKTIIEEYIKSNQVV